MTAMLVPCFQGQYGWMAAGSLHPSIGGLILTVYLTDAGGVGRIAHEFVRFQAVERDWDRAASHQIVETWSDE